MSWGTLASIIAEAAEQDRAGREIEATECPNDGTVLVADSKGRLRCPHDGWSPDWATARRVVM